MAITALTDLSQLPDRTQDQTTFDNNMAYLVRNLPLRAQQENDLTANLNAIAAGGAYALLYTVDLSSTADADPGAGKLRFDSATQNAAATLRLDTTVAGVDVSSLLDQFDASTSTVKGTIRLQKVGDQSKWLVFSVTARAAPAGYRNITVTNTGASTANPFVNGDSVMLFFQRAGDKGSTGPSNYEKLAEAVISAPVAKIDFLNIFTSAYDKYVIEIQGIKASASDIPVMRMAKAGAVDATGSYFQFTPASGTVTASSSMLWTGSAVSVEGSFTAEVLNANDAVLAKVVNLRGAWRTGAQGVISAAGIYYAANAATGFSLYWSGGANFIAGTVRVSGIKNS